VTKTPYVKATPLMSPAKANQILARLVNESEYLRSDPWDSTKREEWTSNASAVLERAFGTDSSVLQRFQGTQAFSLGSHESDEELRLHVNSMLSSMVAVLKSAIEQLNWQVEEDTVLPSRSDTEKQIGEKVFIGHGRSLLWRDLKDFLSERLGLKWDEFNRDSAAGLSTKERLQAMLKDAQFAFLVLTAEDEHPSGTFHARENVIHELGLFQGRLGFERAIILFEEGCVEFSNIHGLTQIRFPKGNIKAVSEEIRRVLEREGILK